MTLVTLLKEKYLPGVLFKTYEAFFKHFCYNRDTVSMDFLLKADLKSINEGVKWLYGGKENPGMAKLLYSWFSRGTVNHTVTFG
jgi:hypothetical protein